ncbi:MAG: DJ-1/PfpI family protein [Sedimentisphaerales bacterium]|nr:DJ-1/PfpI family protein [Sedimentisphaerales bacterium]
MKRYTALIIILATFAVICQGQRRGRVVPQTIIQLAKPRVAGQMSFEEALNDQKDVVIFNRQTLDRNQIGQLAWAAQGSRKASENLQPALPNNDDSSIQIYIATHEGLFIYQPSENSLLQVNTMDVRNDLAGATGQMRASVSAAGCSFIITAPIRRLATARGRSNRTNVYLQAGHIAQNIQLQAVCLDLGSTTIDEFERQAVSAACKLPRNIDPIYLISVGYPGIQTTPDTDDQKENLPKKAAIIVPSVNFSDQEFFETLKALDAASVQRVIASTRTGVIRGMFGNQTEANALVNQIRVDDYDAIIFIGGTGIIEFTYDSYIMNMVREAFDKRKVIAASSSAPAILANAGILKGIKVTATLSEREVLRKNGAIYTGLPLEQHMKIITCSGPAIAVTFARAVTDAITGR